MSSGEKKLILLIDDDTSLLLTLSDFLIHEGYEVVTANSGEQGLKRLGQVEPDLIILDMNMPGMGGVGFLREISSSSGKPSHPVLVLTARANMADFFANVEVEGFIAKPCDPNDLLLEVGRIIFLRSAQPTPDEDDESSRPTGKILLGEDDEEVSDPLVGAFRRAGHEVVIIRNGPDVVERAIVERPDVVVIKRILARLNGDMVADLLHKMPSTQDVPIVLYDSSMPDAPLPDYASQGIGVRRFLRTHNPGEVLNAVEDLLKA